MNPAYRNLAPQQLTAAQQQQLLLQQGLNPSQVVTKMITYFVIVLSFPFSAQLAPVPAALEGWAHRGTSWRREPSISCQHGGADATPGCPTIQVNEAFKYRYQSCGNLCDFRQGSAQNKSFPGKLTQIKEFPIEKSNQQPYKLQKALIDQKIVPCINVR